MFVSGRSSVTPFVPVQHAAQLGLPFLRFRHGPVRRRVVRPGAASDASPEESSRDESIREETIESIELPRDVCLIEGRHSVLDFADLQLEELKAQVESRRSKVFLLLEEIRRLRVQLQLKARSTNGNKDEETEYQSVVPLLNKAHFLQDRNMKKYVASYIWFVVGIILFGGLVAPSLELRMGLGGTSYLEFIQSLHLPEQLAEVDPIVASFCGGAVGSLSTLLVIELNNIKNQQRNRYAMSPFARLTLPHRCYYCKGAGYLPCGACVGSGIYALSECTACSGTGKVMCPNCFCTGKHLVTEHDPRIDPFD